MGPSLGKRGSIASRGLSSPCPMTSSDYPDWKDRDLEMSLLKKSDLIRRRLTRFQLRFVFPKTRSDHLVTGKRRQNAFLQELSYLRCDLRAAASITGSRDDMKPPPFARQCRNSNWERRETQQSNFRRELKPQQDQSRFRQNLRTSALLFRPVLPPRAIFLRVSSVSLSLSHTHKDFKACD